MTDISCSPLSPTRIGLPDRCPRCGRDHLIVGFAKLRQYCKYCGREYSFADAVETKAAGLDVTEFGTRVGVNDTQPSRWKRTEADSYLLGMPQLCLKGLSETWLLKELGHRHWMMLARLAGQEAPCFVDERGAPVYAAFCALSIRDADFGAARENDRLMVTSRLRRVSRTQMLSHHELSISGRVIALVEMVSIFVRRAGDGGNHSVSRFVAPGLPPVAPGGEGDGLASCAAAVRAGRASGHMGFVIDQRQPRSTVSFDPCPSQDFNGAGFLYFSSFIAFVDRAEWFFARERSLRATTVRRDVFFSGNIDPGETLAVRLMDLHDETETLAHHCQMVREQDGAALARIFTFRRLL